MAQKITIFLIFILIISRIAFLGKFPISLNWDEVSHGYNAYSILHTSYDQWGEKLPIFNFRAYGDYPTTLNMYASMSAISILGLNPFSIRIFTSLMGILMVFAVYRLADFFGIKQKKLLFIILIFSNTLFFTSRGVFQSTVASGLYFMGLSLLLSKNKYNWFGLVSLTLSQYAYHNTRIVVPILFVFLYVNRKKYLSPIPKIVIVTCLFLTIISIYNMATNHDAAARNKWVSVFGIEATNRIISNRQNFTGPKSLNRLVNNKFVYAAKSITSNYLWYFSPIPLFFKGTGNEQFNIPNIGLWPFVSLPFLYIGLIYLIFYRKNANSKLFLFLVLLGCLPAALTQGDYPVLRLSLVMPLFAIAIALGLQITSAKYKWLNFVFVLIYLFQFLLFLNKYFFSYPLNYSQSWQYGYQQIVNLAKQKYNQYPDIVVTKRYGEPHEFFLFFWPWNPMQYLLDPHKKTDMHSDWYWVDSFDKFHFINDWDMPKYIHDNPGKKLVFSSQNNLPGDPVSIISYPNQHPAFYIYSYEK